MAEHDCITNRKKFLNKAGKILFKTLAVPVINVQISQLEKD